MVSIHKNLVLIHQNLVLIHRAMVLIHQTIGVDPMLRCDFADLFFQKAIYFVAFMAFMAFGMVEIGQYDLRNV